MLLPQRCDRIAQAVESVAQRRAPLLIPVAMGAGVAAAIAPPAVDAVGATPGSFFGDLDFVGGRMSFEKLTVVGQARQLFGFDSIQCVGQRHVTKPMMMAITFAIGGDMDQLGPIAVIGKAAHEFVDKAVAVG